MLKDIKLKGFCKHTDSKFKFEPGINMIVGANRQGKTQILEAVSFALFGKTKNSKIERIINFDMDYATVNLSLGELKVERGRKANQSKLEKITKVELESNLNLDYSEFLNIFYLSAQDQKSLFDPAYLRNFLIGLFDLTKYSKIYTKLKTELSTLNSIRESNKRFTDEVVNKRIQRVKKIVIAYKKDLEKYDSIEAKINNVQKKLNNQEGQLTYKERDLNTKLRLASRESCPECKRPFDKDSAQETILKIKKKLALIKSYKIALDKKGAEIYTKETKLAKLTSKINVKINQGRKLITILNERLKEKEVTTDKKRIKEIESIMDVFSPKSFPSYLLQVYLPTITETTNNLLQIIFPDTEVSIRTEKPDSNKPDFKPIIHREVKEGKEILEMKDLSGSECAVVNLCFRLGIMIIMKQLTDTCVDFLFIDEGFELIDEANCLKLLDLINDFMRMGYIKQVVLITHKKELKNLENINYIDLGGYENED